ncbi:hypothetical protein K0M31_012576 [Melipona bicolor]|uniref:Uncharacterized protein n=1 Tax=Melipona bicolor TaxID=60889 RepID=A0AA40FJM3_9HYME|nr:hypothetical protein K0M31_012576 [Melipona bicolor]
MFTRRLTFFCVREQSDFNIPENGIQMTEVNIENFTPSDTRVKNERNTNLTYGIDDIPLCYLCLFMVLQVLL